MSEPKLTTIQCSAPGQRYTLLDAPPSPRLVIHLAGPGKDGKGTGPCICGFDRFQRDESGRWCVGFSVGGGFSGPNAGDACPDCAALIGGREITGLHRDLFPQRVTA